MTSQKTNECAAEAAMTTYILSLVEGDAGQNAIGEDIFSPNSPITYSDLDPGTLMWLAEQGYDPENPNQRILVTPAGQNPGAAHVIASRDVAM
ncbi:hypothetical protein [Streptosporangium sp. NPDC000396]|uniref:hypothetical protein n=1 Tax=Streptosporangium sp. NPDC000396 TaxID=3366185 RepID=UPI0036B69F8A